jgi:hypothetical protein
VIYRQPIAAKRVVAMAGEHGLETRVTSLP